MTSAHVIEAPIGCAEALVALGASYDRATSRWSVPDAPGVASRIEQILDRKPASVPGVVALMPKVDEQSHLRDAQDLPEIPGRTPAWRHQRQAYWWALPKKSAYLAMAMGSGKSRVTVSLVEGRGHKRTLIICPKSVVGGWPNQFAVHGSTDLQPVIAALTKGDVPKRVAQAQQCLALADRLQKPAVVIMNYEAVPSAAMQAFLRAAGFDFVVLDEAHKIKAPTGLISKTLWRIFQKQSVYRLMLSGTPLPHSPLDAQAQYRFLDETVFAFGGKPMTWTQFRLRYAQMSPYIINKVERFINQDEMAALMQPLMFQVGRDVLDLPPAHHIKRSIDLAPKTMKQYKELEKEFYIQIETGEVTAANALTRLLRLQQMTSGFVTQDDKSQVEIDSAKREMLAEILDELPSHEPVVVFARFHHDLEAIRAVAEAAGRTYGEVSGRQNDLIESKYPPGVDVLAVQVQSGGAGIDLSRAAYGVYWSLSFSLGEFDQSLARLDRPLADGTKRVGPVTFLHLVATGTVDETIYHALDTRRDVVKAVMERMS